MPAGAPANLCMAFGGTPPFSVRMSRSVAGVWTPIGAAISVTDNNPTCISTPNLQLADNGAQFVFFASNAAGGIYEAMTRTVTVTVNAPAPVTSPTLVSVAHTGAVANNVSHAYSISADGRLVAFITSGTNLVAGFTNEPTELGHAYLRNLTTGVTTLINQTPGGGQSSRGVVEVKIAAGGRYVVFTSLAGDLVPDDTNGSMDVFLRDLQTGTTERLNVHPDGSQITDAGNGVGDSRLNISADGRWVTFTSFIDLVGSNPPAGYELYLRDTQNDVTRRIDWQSPFGVQAVTLSNDGAYIAYVTGITSPLTHMINVYNVQTQITSTVFSVDATIWPEGLANQLSMSGDGRYIAFGVRSAALLGGSTFGQVVVLDRLAPSTVTIASTGAAGVGNSNSYYPRMSNDGRYVLFESTATNLTGAAHTLNTYLMVRDLQAQTTSVASRRPDGATVPILLGGGQALSADGSVVTFTADHNNMFGVMAGAQAYAAPRP